MVDDGLGGDGHVASPLVKERGDSAFHCSDVLVREHSLLSNAYNCLLYHTCLNLSIGLTQKTKF